MKSFHILASAAAAVMIAGAAQAQEMTIVSWGGAYSKSQQNAYHDPYMAKNPGVNIINDESSAEAVAKLRAMAEAGNTTWDVVDVVAADAIRLCDEGLAMEIDPAKHLAPAPDGTSAADDFGDLLVSECFIPQIVYSTTFGYRTDVAEWGGKEPSTVCDIFDTATFPGKRSLEKRPINNVEWALLCDGVAPEDVYDLLGTDAGVDQALAKLATIKDDIIWWSAGAETPQRLADGEARDGFHLQRSSLLGDRGSRSSRSRCCGTGRCSTWMAGSFPTGTKRQAQEAGDGIPATSPPTPSVWLIRRSTSPTVRPASRRRRWSASMPISASTWRRTCRPTREQRQNHAALQLRVLGGQSRRHRRSVSKSWLLPSSGSKDVTDPGRLSPAPETAAPGCVLAS